MRNQAEENGGNGKAERKNRSTDEVTVRRSQEERENQKQRLSSQNPKTDANERMQEFGGKKVEMKQSDL